MKIFLIVLLALLAVSIGGVFLVGPALTDGVSAWKPKPKGTKVRAQVAEPGTLIETISAPGEIEPLIDVRVSARVSAKVLQLPFREGDEVSKGDLICKLDDKDVKAELDRARARRDGERFGLQASRANLDGLMTNLRFAERELERKQQLYDTGDYSRAVLDSSLERVQDLSSSVQATRHSISVGESSLAASEADIARAEDALDNTVILAPMDGIITQLNTEVGEQVLGTLTNIGTTIMTIADLDRMVLKAQVAESDIAKVREDQPAKIHINAYPEVVFTGTVRRVALQRSGPADGTGFFVTEVEIDLQGRRIYSGHVANVEIEIARHEGIIVESQAIQGEDLEELPEDIKRDSPIVDTTKRSINVVYRIIDGKAVCTPVKGGPSDRTHRLVLEGLDAGETVVIGPYKVLESLKHDEAVQIDDAASDKSDAQEAVEVTVKG